MLVLFQRLRQKSSENTGAAKVLCTHAVHDDPAEVGMLSTGGHWHPFTSYWRSNVLSCRMIKAAISCFNRKVNDHEIIAIA